MNPNHFSILSLPQSMLHNLNNLGYETMTPVQAQSLPPILQNEDVIAQAKTGSGKTAAFGIGLLTKLDVKKNKLQSLVLCPTRELADQVVKEIRRLARFTPNIKIMTLCGGMSYRKQVESMRHEPHVIVGTPGRILKHLDKNSLSLEALDTLVIDEAHRMLDMGFIEEINKVIYYAPANRQTLLFSATFPDEIMELSATIQEDAINIQTIDDELPNPITEYFYEVDPDAKLSTLIKLFAHHRPENVIVFCKAKLRSQEIAEDLNRKSIEALAIHGNLEQYERTDVLMQFANRSCSVLIATDVAARGLDIKELEMVINYDMPHDQSTYTHRIGRTGRAGKEGIAITLYSGYEADEYRNDIRLFEAVDSLSVNKRFTFKSPNVTLVIEGGKKNKVRPGDILGALTGDAGIAGKYVGKIDIYDHQSYVAIERSMIDEAYSQLKKGKIKGRKFSVWILK
ncbi:MAG: ATP-dependent RNA helicase DbpA [SAR324 cluster bacterium]|nr:ATP-dependent RNA helicase DbpA [SAR324 cluster bacterium]